MSKILLVNRIINSCCECIYFRRKDNSEGGNYTYYCDDTCINHELLLCCIS